MMAHKTEAEFQAEWDAETIASAAAIRADPARLAAAQAAAPGLVTDAQKQADQARRKASALAKLAKAKKPTSGGRSGGSRSRGTVGASKGRRG